MEEEEAYRIAIIYYMPSLLHLDFVGVTKSDRANSEVFGSKYLGYWEKQHEQLEASYKSQKKAAEITLTEKIMQGGEYSDDEIDDKNTTYLKF